MQHETRQRNRRILLAEDDEINAELYGATLEHAGYLVRYASNGASALEALREENFDCVLMDIEMSVLNGLEATRRIREGETGEKNRSIPIIGMSAHEGGLVSQFVAAGISTFLYKPIELDLLEAVVGACIRGEAACKTTVRHNPPVRTQSTSLDREGALKRLKNNNALLQKITAQVLAEADGQLRDLRAGFAAADYETMREQAHRYAGSLANIGAVRGSMICKEIATLARRGFINHLEKLVNRLDQEIELLKTLVEKP